MREILDALLDRGAWKKPAPIPRETVTLDRGTTPEDYEEMYQRNRAQGGDFLLDNARNFEEYLALREAKNLGQSLPDQEPNDYELAQLQEAARVKMQREDSLPMAGVDELELSLYKDPYQEAVERRAREPSVPPVLQETFPVEEKTYPLPEMLIVEKEEPDPSTERGDFVSGEVKKENRRKRREKNNRLYKNEQLTPSSGILDMMQKGKQKNRALEEILNNIKTSPIVGAHPGEGLVPVTSLGKYFRSYAEPYYAQAKKKNQYPIGVDPTRLSPAGQELLQQLLEEQNKGG